MLLLRSLALGFLTCGSVFADQAPLLSNGPLSSKDSPTRSKFTTGELLHLHKKLVETESITGNEKGVGDWLASYLSDAGLTVEKQEVAKNRYNIFAYPGKVRNLLA
jgi:acetylornithine deacetylase